jgi:hypothetical protein
MATQHIVPATGAAQAGWASILTVLDEDALAEVLHAAKAARNLAQWASLSKQLCRLARSRVPVSLRVFSEEQAGYLASSAANGARPITNCTKLEVSPACSDPGSALAVRVLGLARHWTALQELKLWLALRTVWHPVHHVLSGVVALRNVRCLSLSATSIDASSAPYIQQLTQLTKLHVAADVLSPDAAADLTGLSCLVNLVEVELSGTCAPYLPAGPKGPYCLPTSLTKLDLSVHRVAAPGLMAFWLAHLPGCCQLQHLALRYLGNQHASAHPGAVVRLLAEHNCPLRSLCVFAPERVSWGEHVDGLPDEPAGDHWYPDASLAALTGLASLSTYSWLGLRVENEQHWQHLAQLTRLTWVSGVYYYSAPPEGCKGLALQRIWDAWAYLDGRCLGQVLLAHPQLQKAWLSIRSTALPAAGARLTPHPTLRTLRLGYCQGWGDEAAASAHVNALAPVLQNVSKLVFDRWPHGSSGSTVGLPDLSPCTALTRLDVWGVMPDPQRHSFAEQQEFISMLAPLRQLKKLRVKNAPKIDVRVVVAVQSLLLELQSVELWDCGSGTIPFGDQQYRDEQAALKIVQEQQLRPGLEFETVYGTNF